MASARSSTSTGVTSGRSWPPVERIGAEHLGACGPPSASRGSLDSTRLVDIGVERLAELGEVDLVGEVVELDEIEAVAQRRAAHRRTDLHARVGLAVAVDVDIDRRRARLRVGGDDLALELAPRRSRANSPASFGLPYLAPAAVGIGLSPARAPRRTARPSARDRERPSPPRSPSTILSGSKAGALPPRPPIGVGRILQAVRLMPTRTARIGQVDCCSAWRPVDSAWQSASNGNGGEGRPWVRPLAIHVTPAQLVSAKVSSLAALSPLISTQSISCFSFCGRLLVLDEGVGLLDRHLRLRDRPAAARSP